MTIKTMPNKLFSDNGLNQHAVFDLKELPSEVISKLSEHVENIDEYTQLILIANSGPKLWDKLQTSGFQSEQPIDDFTISLIHQFFKETLAEHKYDIIYPSSFSVNLQKLGELAGWHYASPFRIGINKVWGTWFAYRAVILSNTHLPTTSKLQTASPCDQCVDKPCIKNCPTTALDTGTLELKQCIDYRKQANSKCKDTCHARVSCPIAKEKCYTQEQINYHYSISMKCIDELY